MVGPSAIVLINAYGTRNQSVPVCATHRAGDGTIAGDTRPSGFSCYFLPLVG